MIITLVLKIIVMMKRDALILLSNVTMVIGVKNTPVIPPVDVFILKEFAMTKISVPTIVVILHIHNAILFPLNAMMRTHVPQKNVILIPDIANIPMLTVAMVTLVPMMVATPILDANILLMTAMI
jgi:hypothetical protein